jgi:uncharacterized Tic20 family protein
MRKTGVFLGLLGLLMFLGGLASFATSFSNTANENEAGRLNLQLEQGYQSERIRIDNQQLVRLAIRMRVTTTSAQEIRQFEEQAFQARYRFPLQVYVKDSDDQVLHVYDCDIAWDSCGSRSSKDAGISSQGGSLQVTHKLASFDPGEAETIHIEALLGRDTDYVATASDIQLIVYDQVSRDTGWILGGMALVIVGPILFIVGLVLFVLAPVARGEDLAKLADDSLPDASVRNMAMAVHLAALTAWVGVPFGHIIGPLIVWLTQKDSSEFVDRQGRESLNFQLSITLYSVIAFLLCFIFIGFLLLPAIFIMHITLSIIAAMRANEGQYYRYPMTIRFVR